MQHKVSRICAVLVGAVFLFSGIAKLVTIETFEVLLIDQGIAGARFTAAYMARLLVASELFLGVGLCQRRFLRRLFVPVTALTLIGFSIYLVMIAGNTDDCGCFGGVLKMSPVSALIRNLIMLGMLGYVWARRRPDPPGRWEPIGLVGACALVAVFVFFPITIRTGGSAEQQLGQRFQKDTRFIKLQELAKPESFHLLHGEILVALLSPDCDHCRAMAEHLGRFTRNHPSAPPAFFVFLEDGDLVSEFLRETGTDVPHCVVPPRLFMKLIGKAPPRLYHLREGRVVQYWDEEAFSREKLDALW